VSVSRVAQPSAQAQGPQRTSAAMAVIMTGVLMTAVDTTIVVLALPEIQRGLHVTLSAVVWVIISFLHAAFYASMGFMALAAGLSALRARRS
jgi:hypothetical protein